MDSIANVVQIRKGGLGYVIEGQKGKFHGSPPPSRSSGDITTFSTASRKRLRMTLATAQHKDGGNPFGVTLTIPGRILTPEETRKLWDEWGKHILTRKYSDCLVIWRIELQTRKQAHWHCVVWCKGSIQDGILQCTQMAADWRRLVYHNCNGQDWQERTVRGFEEHGVDIKPLSGASSTGVIGYLCDHTSKHKQEQLGWVGRQWGVVNRKAMTTRKDTVEELPERVHALAVRQFRRLQERLRARGGKYTGVRISYNNNISAAIFGNDAERWLLCCKIAKADGHEWTPPKKSEEI